MLQSVTNHHARLASKSDCPRRPQAKCPRIYILRRRLEKMSEICLVVRKPSRMQLCELAKTRLDALLHRLFHNRKITEPDTLQTCVLLRPKLAPGFCAVTKSRSRCPVISARNPAGNRSRT